VSILVYSSQKGNPVTDSRRVAKAFGRSHKNVLRPLRDLPVTAEFRAAHYWPGTYTDKRGREQPLITMTTEGEQKLVQAFTARRVNLAATRTYFLLAQGLDRVKIGKAAMWLPSALGPASYRAR
jgi:Rha family phage regulatory protein